MRTLNSGAGFGRDTPLWHKGGDMGRHNILERETGGAIVPPATVLLWIVAYMIGGGR